MTVVGNLVDEPEHRHVRPDLTLVRFRIASNHRYRDSQTREWKDGTTLFLDCFAWRNIADNCAASLHRGDRVVVVGRLTQQTYTDRQRRRHTTYELECDEVAVSLRAARAAITRTSSTQRPVVAVAG